MDYQDLPQDQKDLIDAVDDFAAQMKARLTVKFAQGYEGWKTQYDSEEIINQIENRLPRMLDPEDAVEVGIANWALINHLIKNKQNG